ncbi:MAG TPA: PP2C family protein-serine/threonine phosphatase, partial [Mycobacteriales bacterium]|nr:PP2C family protein-serine/threonine phosphatase [Mycobacteriales bacterium]
MPVEDRVARAVAWLLRTSHLMPPGDLPAAADQAVRMAGRLGCRVHLVTRDQRSLVALGPPDVDPAPSPMTVDGTVAGRAYRDTEVMVSADGARLWLPLLDGTERLGVLEVAVAPGDDAVDELAPLAALVAELVVSKGQYTDTFERARRALPMGVPAELLWRQLPPMTFGTERFVVAAQLEPWHEVGGDAFDYSIDGDVLRLAVFDAMGHGLGATLMAGVALAVYRNCRRAGRTLVETAEVMDRELAAQFGDESFVTAVLAELDLVEGTIRLLSAAHPAPLLVRDGKALGELDTDPGLPLGFGSRDDVVVQASLQPGDRVLMFSDGVVEARSPDGAFFGADRLVDLLTRAESRRQSSPETLRRLVLAVLEHQNGTLQDDATLLMLEWAGESAAIVPTWRGDRVD